MTAHTSHVSAALHRDSVHAPQAQITMTRHAWLSLMYFNNLLATRLCTICCCHFKWETILENQSPINHFVCVSVCLHLWLCLCSYVCVYMSVCVMCICVCACLCVCGVCA